MGIIKVHRETLFALMGPKVAGVRLNLKDNKEYVPKLSGFTKLGDSFLAKKISKTFLIPTN